MKGILPQNALRRDFNGECIEGTLLRGRDRILGGIWNVASESDKTPCIVADMKHSSTHKPAALRSVHTEHNAEIESPFLLNIFYEISACMTQGLTSNREIVKESTLNKCDISNNYSQF